MTSKITILVLATLLVAVIQRADGSLAMRTPSHVQPCVGHSLADLRSAYLQRAGVVRYDESNATPRGLSQQLQRHFDAVLSLLDSATPDSIEIAVIRLEGASDYSWTARERAAWRQKLLTIRLVQIQRLTAYRDRGIFPLNGGIFPLNEGQSANPAPIFVDRHGTACAVGYLMRCAGWTAEVDSIARSNNLVYVPDAVEGPLARWVLTSGLTLEEAALIQPDYYWPAGQYDASAYEPGESVLDNNGLRFSNFKLQATTNSTIVGLGLSAGQGTFTRPGPTPFPVHTPIGTNWIAIGGTNSQVQAPLHSLKAIAGGQAQTVTVSFDVAPIDTNQRITGVSESNYSYWQGFRNLSFADFPPAGSICYLKTTALNGPTTLAYLNIDQSAFTPGTYFNRQSATQSFAAQQQIHVDTTVFLQNGPLVMDTYLLDFNVVSVPEPSGAFLVATVIVIVAYGQFRTRRRLTAMARGYPVKV